MMTRSFERPIPTPLLFVSTRHSVGLVHGDAKDLSLLYRQARSMSRIRFSRVLNIINKLYLYI